MMFLHPEYLFLLPVIIIFIFFLVRRQFVTVKNPDSRVQKTRKLMRTFVFFSRTTIFTLLLFALAAPFQETTSKVQGNLKLTILYDNSTSMDIFDMHPIPTLLAGLKKELPLQLQMIATGLRSPLGEGILNSLEEDSNILLISDGNSHEGISMEDAGLFAASLNATISAVALEPVKQDVGVAVFGPTKTVTDAENNILARVVHFGTKDYTLSLTIDDIPIPDTEVRITKGENSDEIFFTRRFDKGYHKIVARITADNDYFPQNNVFYKTIHVVDKPSILFVSQKSDPLLTIVDELYDVTKAAIIPKELDKYYAVVLNDIPAEDVRNLEPLTNFAIDGNGIAIIGGEHSFDGGKYKGSLLESILPVTVGKGERKRGNSNIVVVIDISGTTGETYELVNGKLVQTAGREQRGLSLAKALAMSVVDSLSQTNKIGAVAFATEAYKVEDIAPLYQNKKVLLDKLSRLKGSGQSYFHVGLLGANELLKNVQGDKNVILFTDGMTFNDGIKQQTKDIASAMASRGTKVYVVGVGAHVDEQFLKDTAENGNGIYFHASEANRFKVIFGEAEEKPQTGPAGLVILNSNHFITKDLDIDAIVQSTNQVVPKANAQLLISNNVGEPIVTVWRYGLGRVTTITGFSGDNLGELLSKRNSRLMTRIFNWNIGDPERKKEYVVSVDDTRINTPSKAFVKSKKVPVVERMEFSKVEKDMYQSVFTQQKEGFHKLLEATYAADYEREYQDLGMSQTLHKIVASSGGKLFKPTETKQIADFVKSVSRRERREKRDLKEYFLVAAMVIFLLEIAIRRFKENDM